MLDLAMRRRLRRLLGGPSQLRREHARELEAELLERFDQVRPGKETYKMRRLVFKKVLVACAAVLLVGAAACAAPADVDVEVGRSITIRSADEAALPDPEALAELVRGEGRRLEVTLRVRKESGALAVELQVWGDELPDEPLAKRIREAFPALARAEIREEPLEGTLRGTLGAKLGHELLDLDVVDQGDAEALRRKLMERFAAEGVEGRVDVQVEQSGSQRKVKVRVQQEDCPPGEDASATEPSE
jgi:hypothetical protein